MALMSFSSNLKDSNSQQTNLDSSMLDISHGTNDHFKAGGGSSGGSGSGSGSYADSKHVGSGFGSGSGSSGSGSGSGSGSHAGHGSASGSGSSHAGSGSDVGSGLSKSKDRKPGEPIMAKMGNETLKAELGRSTWKLLHTMAG
ncbi:hypothetical protein HDU76_010684, partial [Blyttiomyces sp. JEL0837]